MIILSGFDTMNNIALYHLIIVNIKILISDFFKSNLQETLGKCSANHIVSKS